MRFSIRDLLLVTVIVALAVTRWVDISRLVNEIKKLKGLSAYFKLDVF